MFALWLRSDPSPSYQTLARALFRADENRIATEICTNHGKVSLMHMEIFQNSSLQSDYCESDSYFSIIIPYIIFICAAQSLGVQRKNLTIAIS